MESAALVGRVLGEFEVLERLSGGGFGEVFRARQATLGRDAVIKVLKSTIGELAQERFTQEAQLASRLDHPYAAHIYAFGAEPDGLQWIAMELVRGTSLADLLKVQGAIALSRFLPLFQSICQVVHAAHEQHIVHRDIKPANVMVVSRAGVLFPKLVDFGIARLSELENEAEIAQVEERLERLLVAAEGVDPTKPREKSGSGDDAKTMQLDKFDHELDRLFAQRHTEIAAHARERSLGLTDGLYVGSPAYMAPELWLGPHAAGPLCDIYALGILAYECLSGRPPFPHGVLTDMARAHLIDPLPKLGPSLPPALHAVLARATAKRARDRYPDALSLWRAVEAACSTQATEPLPKLPAHLGATLFARAPQPIAETLAAAEAANRVGDAWTRYLSLVELACQYAGVVALASQARLGQTTDPVLREALLAAAKGHVEAKHWLDLACEITRPFVRMRDAFPVPELVDACHKREGAERGSIDALRALLDLASAFEQRAPERTELAGFVDAIAKAFVSFAELFEYDLVVRSERGFELWLGQRRRPRLLVDASATDIALTEPVLLDRYRSPVLSLWPVVHAIVPTPSADPELFMFAGGGRYGARLVAYPAGFERQDPELATHLDKLAGGGTTEQREQVERAPYRGLASFSIGDSELFFGRERESEHLANHLRARAFAAVVGPSGAGKSSFVQAGVLPLLPSDWHAVVMRPGSQPLATLQQKLAALGIHIDAANPAGVMERLEATMRSRNETLVIVIDQAEEIVTLCRDEATRAAFAQILAAVRDDERVRVVLTLRDDFLMRVQRLPGLGERLASAIHLLGVPSRADLRRILVEPAKRMGYQFEDQALVDEIAGALIDNPSALPLLSFTAARLWELRDRQFKKLRRKVYASLGGVGGALAQHAEEVITQMSPEERELVREAFRNLVTADGTRAVIEKSELLEALGGGAHAARVLEGLVDARLVVTSESAGGITVEVTHEALLDSWPRLVGWRRDDAETARLREQLRTSARQWDARGRQRGLLWRGDVLVEYKLWRGRYRGRLTELEEAFSQACVREDERSQLRRRALLATAFTVLIAAAVVLYVFAARARTSAKQATTSTIELLEEQGRRELLDQHPLHAAGPLVKAYKLGGNDAMLKFLLARAMTAVDARGAVLVGHTGFVGRVVASADGTRLVTASDDKTARLWDASTGAQLQEMKLPSTPRFARTPDGVYVALAVTGELLLVRTQDLGVARRWPLDADVVPTALAMDSKGARFALGDSKGRIHLIEGDTHAVVQAHKARVSSITATDTVWASGGADGHVAIGSFDASAPRDCEHGKGIVTGIAIDAAGARVASGGTDGVGKVWDATSGALVRTLAGHAKTLRSIAISPDGTRVATASEDASVRLWDVTNESLPRVLAGHQGIVLMVGFDRSGQLLVSTGADATVRLWNVATGTPAITFDGHDAEVLHASFDVAGERVLSASLDGTGRVWTLPHVARRLEPPTVDGGYVKVAWLDDRLVTAGGDGAVRVHDATGKVTAQLGGSEPLRALAVGGRTRVVIGGESSGLVRVWDPESGTARDVETIKGGAYVAQFRPDGNELIVAGADGVVRVIDPSTWAITRKLEGHTAGVWGGAYAPDGKRFASASDDRTVRIWDVASGTSVRTIGPLSSELNAVAFDSRGERIACVGADGMLRVYRIATGELLREQAAHHANTVAVVFSPDDNRVVTAAYDNTAVVWDARSLKELARMETHRGAVLGLAWKPGTNELLTSGADSALWLTNLGLEQRSPPELESALQRR